VPHFQRAGWPVRRVLTDGGPEFKGAFDVACRALGLRHTRTNPRHAWTNGFVERLQGARSFRSSGAWCSGDATSRAARPCGALDNALTLVRERAGRRGIALQTSIDERLGEVRADEPKIRQVVLNLLPNAIKFTLEGGRIEVAAVPKGPRRYR
jgi:hypothetical protein